MEWWLIFPKFLFKGLEATNQNMLQLQYENSKIKPRRQTFTFNDDFQAPEKFISKDFGAF